MIKRPIKIETQKEKLLRLEEYRDNLRAALASAWLNPLKADLGRAKLTQIENEIASIKALTNWSDK